MSFNANTRHTLQVALFALLIHAPIPVDGDSGSGGQFQLIVGTSLNSTGTNHDVFEVDVVGDVSQPLLPAFPVGGATYDAANDRVLFTSSSGSSNIDQLWEWPVGGALNNLGTITDAGDDGAQRIDGLAISDGVLYGAYAGGTAEDGIWTIDTTTLEATLVFPFSDSVSGIDADPITGDIYGANDTTASLVLIDVSGQQMSTVAAYPKGVTADIDGLAVGIDGRAYLITDEPGSLYVYNLDTDEYETPLTAPWTSADTFSGGAFIGAVVEAYTPTALVVDPDSLASDSNGVFEPNEQIEVAPSWRNDGNVLQNLMGTASNFTGPAGADYELVSDGADYGAVDPDATASCLDTDVCYVVGVDDPAVRPATHWEATIDELLDDSGSTSKTWTLHIGDSFPDVPRSSLFYTAIETLLHSGVTAGCGSGEEYCPGDANSRAQMPVFMLRALMGPDYTPPPCVEGEEPFDDVPFDSVFCPWIQDLADLGIVSGCGGDDYCPSDPVSRAQMAIFILRTLNGAGYEPPACTNLFTDVPCPSLFADWIEDLAGRGITGGCSETEYCPSDAVTRGQMAVFISKAFGFTLYGP